MIHVVKTIISNPRKAANPLTISPHQSQNAGFNTEVSWQSFVKAVLGDVDLITARELDPLRTLLCMREG